jgi:hypothetical protein
MIPQAREWEENTVRRRPWRPHCFDAFICALNNRFGQPFTALELGAGPGHLAEQILERCAVTKYTALDFSAAIHQIARQRFSAFVQRADFVERDYRSPGWAEGLGVFDAVATPKPTHRLAGGRILERPKALGRGRDGIVFCREFKLTAAPLSHDLVGCAGLN